MLQSTAPAETNPNAALGTITEKEELGEDSGVGIAPKESEHHAVIQITDTLTV